MLSADRRRRPARRIRRATAQSRSGHEHQQARWLVSLKLSTTPYQATYLRSITTKPPEVSPMSCNMPHHGTGPKGVRFQWSLGVRTHPSFSAPIRTGQAQKLESHPASRRVHLLSFAAVGYQAARIAAPARNHFECCNQETHGGLCTCPQYSCYMHVCEADIRSSRVPLDAGSSNFGVTILIRVFAAGQA